MRTGWQAGDSSLSVTSPLSLIVTAFAPVTDVRRVATGQAPVRDYPGIAEGLRGLRFIAQAVASSRAGAVWMDL